MSLPADSWAGACIPHPGFWRSEDTFCALSSRWLPSGLFPETSLIASLIPQPGMLDSASAPSSHTWSPEQVAVC